MNKHVKPIVMSAMVLTLGLSLTACGQGRTVKEETVRMKNDVNRIGTRSTMPYNTGRIADNRNYVDGTGIGVTDNTTGMTNNRMGTNTDGLGMTNRGTTTDGLGMTNRGTTDGLGMTNRGTTTDGLGMKSNDVNRVGVNYHKEAKQLADRARLVSGVKKATVVVNNKDAIVGIDVNNVGKKATIEKQVHAALKNQYPHYNIHVTSDPNLHKRINTMNVNMGSAHPVKTLANDVAIMIRDIGAAVTRPLR